MPGRPREHELDDLAELAFRSAIPIGWVWRPTDRHDYGVDGTVEIFDSGRATGLVFNVQLKGTDEDQDGRSAARVRVDTGAYWNRLHLPTLVVRHHAGSDHLYVRWWHEHAFQPADEQKTMTVRFETEHRWMESSPHALVSGVAAFHRVRSARVRLPLPVTLDVDAAVTGGHPPGVERNAVRSAFERLPRLVSLSTSETAPDESVEVAITEVTIEARLGGGVTEQLPNKASQVATVGFDVLLTVALGLGRIGLASTASALLDIGLPGSSHRDAADVVARFGRTYLAAHRVGAGVDLAELLLEEGATPSTVLSLLRELVSTTGAHSQNDERAVARGLETCAEKMADDQLAAFALMLAATSIRRVQPDLSVAHLRSAADRAPELLTDATWRERLAGSLVDAERADEAIPLYRDLINEKPDVVHLRACLADSLLIAGQMSESARTFAEYRTAGGQDRRWVASERVASELAAQGIEGWEAAAIAFDFEIPADDPGHPLPYECRVALGWFNAGVTADRGGRPDEALIRYLAAVVLFVIDDEAWVQATVHALELGDPHLFVSVAQAAYRQRGYAFLDRLRTMVVGQAEPGRAAEFLDILDMAIDERRG